MKRFAENNIHWYGHDTFKLAGEKTVYVDPYQLTHQDTADIICVSHDHFDHCSPDDIAKVRGAGAVIVGPEDCLKKLTGPKQTIKIGQKVSVEGLDIEAVPAYNTDKEFHPKQKGWIGYIITLNGFRVYHSGDTDHIPEMKSVKADIALLPVSGTYVMTAEEAAQAALDIHPGLAIPMHYGSVVGDRKDAERFKTLLEGKIEVIIKERVAG